MRIPIEKPGNPEELVHYGVKGMHWGIHKAEETVGSARTFIKEKKTERKLSQAQLHENAAANLDKEIRAVKTKPSKIWFVQHQRDEYVKELEQYRDQHLKDAKDLREGRLTDQQKHNRNTTEKLPKLLRPFLSLMAHTR